MTAGRRDRRRVQAVLARHGQPGEVALEVAAGREPGGGPVTLAVTDRALYALPAAPAGEVVVLPHTATARVSPLGEVLLVLLADGRQLLYGLPSGQALPLVLADQVRRAAVPTSGEQLPEQRAAQAAERHLPA